MVWLFGGRCGRKEKPIGHIPLLMKSALGVIRGTWVNGWGHCGSPLKPCRVEALECSWVNVLFNQQIKSRFLGAARCALTPFVENVPETFSGLEGKETLCLEGSGFSFFFSDARD